MTDQAKPKGLFFGLTTVDICNGLHAHPGPNEKVRADWQEVYAGGPAANGAVAYAALGNRSYLCSGVGSHAIGQFARKDLAEHQVVLLDHAGDPRKPPVISSIMINTSTGDRCVVYTNTTSGEPLRGLHAAVLLEDVSVLLFDGFFSDQAVDLAGMARERKITTVLDGGSWKDGITGLLPFIDYAICSEDFLPPGCTSPREVLIFLADHTIHHAAVSRGGRPLLVSENGSFGSIEVPPVTAVDTLGAGDILHGAFCHFIGFTPFSGSLSRSAVIASESCRYRGTRQWIRYLPPAGSNARKE